ncbi:MAG: TonB-dependent receptor [Alphaproteobacteria bacterium]|nr:TonB-dependent receptor [Alphaproteobacteria bacterium]MBU2042169.1 TonB-dependent receptor [Alphaproteobacteria bacterium]MBU2125008.1 TonB-dependent receptor [Alphaproteobacteria bacterium]MBU2289658.1 TonB-dependent receptor [Alphaproteobacteria bacterium]MBU2398453.1 TonB-dependent receptor [Alphaproteobacteria bacterium]
MPLMKLALLLGAALAPLAFADAAFAQSGQDAAPQAPTSSLDEVIVTGEPVMRNRTDDVVSTLSYDLEFFQRFEPLTVGDALKRVPSVTFLSDVLESDGVRLRGLDPGYTQILINGERVPGGEADRSFFVDRIPAELIDRVEVVRSSSANRSGDALAGTINIVLRDALALDGGYIRAGALLFPDDEVGTTFGAVYGGQVGPGRLLVGASVQDRRNPKLKFSQRFDEPGGTLDNVEVQTDVRDGTDYSFNAAYEVEVGGGTLDLSGVFVRTDRFADEDSIEYADGVQTDVNILSINDNDVDIQTDNLALRARYERDMLGGETRIKLGYASFDDEQEEFENEAEYLRDGLPFPEEDRYTAELEFRDLQDEEVSFAVEHSRPLGDDVELEFGVQTVSKDRDSTTVVADRVRFNIPNAPAPRPAQPPFVFDTNSYVIEETRIDPYVMVSGESGALKWEAGLRYETTDTTIAGIDNDFAVLLPSASLRYRLSDSDRLTLSVARTVRRPDFDDLAPVTLEEERGDNDFRGNPLLEPETAWGVDLGFERRLGRRGVIGVNAFYRDVTDLIEDVNTGLEGSGGPGTFIESIDNVGDGQVYGVEFDLSTPLDFIGMETTGVFLNASWLDSQVEDVFGERRFNNQSDYVVNFGFTHDIPSWGAAFGASYRKQGDAFERVWAEEVATSYGADLEIFIEKQIFSNTVIRLTGSNLLDSSKDEVFDKFDDQADQIARDYDEYELETESAGPVFQLVMRVAF